MRVGICTDISNIVLVERLGYDYIEMNGAQTAAMTDDEFNAARSTVNGAKIKCEAFNVLVPSAFTLLDGTEQTALAFADYLGRLLPRIRELGGEVVVFGSGSARRIPDGLDFAEATRRLVDVLRVLADAADANGIRVAIEPLCRAECNIINTVTEGALIAALANRANLGTLADCYHMYTDNEPLDSITRIGDLFHVHIATPGGRCFPLNADEPPCDFLDLLQKSGYNGRVSIEGRTDCFESDAAAAIKVLKLLRCMLI